MTVETPRQPWNDDRLDAAFAARAVLHPTPPELTTITLHAIGTSRSGWSFGWRQTVAALASIAILLVVLASTVVVSGGLRIRMDESSPSPTAGATTDGSEVLGLPIRSVVEALAVRDAGIDDGEIAVHGWFPPLVPVPCPYTPATSPVQPVCPDDQIVLMADPEMLVTQNGNGYSRATPTGPAFQIDLDVFQINLDDLAGGWRPTEIVVVGHFDDRSASSCPPDMQAACRDRFVVDRVDRVHRETQPTSRIDLLEGVGMPFHDAEHILDALRPGVSILSAVHVDGDGGLWQIDPALAEGGSSLLQEARLWVVRVLDAGQLGTYAIVDSSGSLYELTPDGPVLVALSTPGEPVSPSASPSPTPPAWGPWPPQNAFSVVEFKDDSGRKPFVAIVDASGLLASVAEGVPDPGIGDGAFEGFVRDPSGPHRYRLRWTTTVCDREMTVSIARGVARIVIEHAPRDGCDAMAIGRDLVLEFSQDVDPAAVELQVIQPTRLPEPPPEPTTMVVELDRGDSTESVLVIDHTASLMMARAADPIPNIPDFSGVRIVRAEDGGTIVMWDGLLCDRDLWISIEADAPGHIDWIGVHGTQADTCRLARVRRAIWLDLGPIDVAPVGAQMAVAPRTESKRDAGPIIGVAEALVVRSHAADDHQLKVRGWYWRDPAVYDCFVPPSPPPALESGCQGPHDRFVADPNDLTGPGFTVWLRPGVDTAMLRYGDPNEVVIVGHFDDTLSETCTFSTRESCRDVFVIEEILAEPAS